jgi:hypothetical protein
MTGLLLDLTQCMYRMSICMPDWLAIFRFSDSYMDLQLT